MDTVIADGLRKNYNDFTALDCVSFFIKKGEIFGLLGPNGAGKTTTIKMLSGLLRPSLGTATIIGHDVVSDPVAVKKSIGVVPETSNLYPELTCFENLVFAGRLYGIKSERVKIKADELLMMFGLSEKRDLLFAKLSSGMKRRLTVAASLIHDPQVLFLDEPTTGLDVMSARSLREIMQSLKNRGITILLTTHYIEEADRLCDRIAIIVKGRIMAIDAPATLKNSVGVEKAVDIKTVPDKLLGEIDMAGLSSVKRVEMKEDGARFFIEDMNTFLSSFSAFAGAKGITIESVHTVSPSLEDAFVQITGLKSEIMVQEKGGGR
jgi:ABC-2 type transport system ATP-binding protein